LKIDLAVRLLNLCVMTPMTNQDQLPVTIDLHVSGIEITDELRKAVERIVVFALDRYDAQMDKISVHGQAQPR
jgi:hypothetical protein